MRYFKDQTINPGDLVAVSYSNWITYGIAIADTGNTFQYHGFNSYTGKNYIYGSRYMDRVIKLDPKYHLDAEGLELYKKISKEYVNEYQDHWE